MPCGKDTVDAATGSWVAEAFLVLVLLLLLLLLVLLFLFLLLVLLFLLDLLVLLLLLQLLIQLYGLTIRKLRLGFGASGFIPLCTGAEG